MDSYDRLVVTVDDVRRFAMTLPRTTEGFVGGRVKFYVGRIVYVSFSRDGKVMGFAFPKDQREWLVGGSPHKFLMPEGRDLRYHWVLARMDQIDEKEMRELVIDAWRMVVPKGLGARVAAKPEVQTAPVVEVAPMDPAHPDAQHCLNEYFLELDRRFDSGFDPTLGISATIDELRLPAGLLLVATRDGAPVGCGALKLHGREPAELKRMWVDPSARGLGLGRRLLIELERHAAQNGASVVRLETNRNLLEAISLYRSAGYREVAPFNDEPYAHHWFEKRLPGRGRLARARQGRARPSPDRLE